MKSRPPSPVVHVCGCPDCQRGLRGEIVEEQRAINLLIATLDERWRRLFAGFWATAYGRGGIEHLAVITGLSRTTIRRGKKEFRQPGSSDATRIRKPGGGRKRIEKRVFGRICGLVSVNSGSAPARQKGVVPSAFAIASPLPEVRTRRWRRRKGR